MTRLGKPESYFESLPRELEAKRDFMVKFLSDAGMVPTVPEGGYFIVADWTGLSELNLSYNLYNRYQICTIFITIVRVW